jgi:hypothetical protein
MAEWSKDHVTAIDSLNLKLWLMTETWLKWRPGGATRGKERQLIGKVVKWVCGKPAPIKLQPPHVSVKDRSVALHE